MRFAMPVIRFELDDELQDKLMLIKGDRLKVPFTRELLIKAINSEYKNQIKKGLINKEAINKRVKR